MQLNLNQVICNNPILFFAIGKVTLTKVSPIGEFPLFYAGSHTDPRPHCDTATAPPVSRAGIVPTPSSDARHGRVDNATVTAPALVTPPIVVPGGRSDGRRSAVTLPLPVGRCRGRDSRAATVGRRRGRNPAARRTRKPERMPRIQPPARLPYLIGQGG
ncbi:hypothetical protein AVEN_136972-1 [Araneus ventricosus]|uniref:Uncharacterized protein n=1 Tax=Araneus ventricosus TaxID=182803 RepID=A0A4Y2BJT8_ARAVE|nr:hypothetical protein AVEN_136972-1 [Araneus ventricosus]